jgi:hypothetical protein
MSHLEPPSSIQYPPNYEDPETHLRDQDHRAPSPRRPSPMIDEHRLAPFGAK